MLAVLDSRFQFAPEQELSDWMENLLCRMRRKRGEETTAYTTRFETTLAKVEDLITAELRLERRRQQDFQRAEFRRASLDYMVALQAHQATVAGLTEGATQPEPTVGPPAPEEPPVVEQFQSPEVIKGFLYLRHVGITLQTWASLLRSSGGSLRYEKEAELLRKTELDAMVVGRATSQDDDYDEDYDDEEDWSGEDDFGGFAEDEETEGAEGNGGELAEEDEDYDSAMLGYLEARQKLMALRKARGFKEPSDQGAETKQAPSYRSRPSSSHRDGHRNGKPRSSSSAGRSRDFQWKERSRHSSSSQRRPRQKTPPPGRDRRAKGKGKGKSPGKRQGARKEPTGAQYLGMAKATSSGAASSQQTPFPVQFQPEFNFMAVHSGNVATQEFGIDPAAATTSVESLKNQCLVQDDLLGLCSAASARAEACCPVTPLGTLF